MQSVQEEVAKNARADEAAQVNPTVKRQQDRETWEQWLQAYTDRLGRERAAGTCPEDRIKAMNCRNPAVLLRNWVAQVAIDAASRGDYSVVRLPIPMTMRPAWHVCVLGTRLYHASHLNQVARLSAGVSGFEATGGPMQGLE